MMRVGIDLGTTNTVVSFIDENGCWQLLTFQRCGRTDQPQFLPSCIAVQNGMVIVGQPALDHMLRHPDEGLVNTKYDMGNPEKTYVLGGLTVTPVQAAEWILKEVANELGRQFPQEKAFHAFVTVPARFRTEARLATKAALRAAGFFMDDICLTDEPIAAAIAYSTRLDRDRLVLVVDIGGGTYDLSLLKTSIVGASNSPDRLEPVAWDGDLHLGGNDVDELLVKKMTMQFVRAGGQDLYARAGSVFPTEAETRAAAMIRSLPLQLKQQLYAENSERAAVFVPDLLGGVDLDFTITRAEYESEMRELSLRFAGCVENLFVGTGYARGAVDHVLVVGGMAHEICLRRTLANLFGEDALIVPEEAMLLVSKGAAICNSNLKLQVDNKAYTSIGLLSKGGTAVEPVFLEGDVVQPGQVFASDLSPTVADATAVVIELVEYRGTFSKENYTTILREEVQLIEHGAPHSGLFDRLLHKKKLPKLHLTIALTEDKLFQILVTQEDGSVTNISHRLGGR